MLVLSRKPDERMMIGNPGQQIRLTQPIVVTVVEVRGDKVRFGIEAQDDIPIHREEVYEAIQKGSETCQ